MQEWHTNSGPGLMVGTIISIIIRAIHRPVSQDYDPRSYSAVRHICSLLQQWHKHSIQEHTVAASGRREWTKWLITNCRNQTIDKSLFYLPTVNAHHLQANHCLTTTLTCFGICLCHLQGVLDYTGCARRNGQNFGRVFLMLSYTNITQNIYIQSWTVTEIMAREVWNFDICYTLIDYQIHIKTGRNMWFL